MHDETEDQTGHPPPPTPNGARRGTAQGPPLVAGATIGDLELGAELGRGSTGSVFRARLRRARYGLPLGAEVAAKFLRPELVGDATAQARLTAEGRLGRQINSAQVVCIFDVVNTTIGATKLTYLVMELIRGHNLRSVIDESGSVVEELARQIGWYATRGLRAIHRLGLVHRDIKPENIALTDAGTVKLMDLGLTRKVAAGAGDSSGSGFYGSLSYAAPEVLRSEPASGSSDLYSLGVVLFELVTGRHPFADADTQPDEVIHRHLYATPPHPSHFRPRISAFLEQLILDLLAKQPADRAGDIATIEAAFEHGENSRYWLRHEQRAPRLAAHRRLRVMRRVADTPFIGRRGERRQLDRCLQRTADARGQAVFLSGPRGMGRRRLLDHWIEGALQRRSDLTFLGGECRPDDGTKRAAPFTGMVLESYLRGDRPDSPQAQSRLAARIAARGNSDFEPHEAEQLAAIACDADTGSTPEERADLLARSLLAMSSGAQTLIVRVDLAERMSTTTELVVQRLIEGLPNRRLLLLLVSLDRRRPPANTTHLALSGLDEDEFLEFGRRLFEQRKIDKSLLRDAHQTLAGSPGNLLEALATLRRQDKLSGTVGSYRLITPVTQLRPAESLLDRLRERLAGLTEPERFVHVAAGVLGNSFPISDLSRLVGQSEISVLETLSIFQSRIIVTHRGTGRFRHRDFRKVMLDTLPPTVLSRLHRTAAWTLEDRGAEPLEIGLHWSRAGEHGAAIAPLLAGLAQLVAKGSRKSSLRTCSRLRVHFDALPPNDQRQSSRLRFLALAGQAEEMAERAEPAHRCFAQMHQLATELDQPAAQVDARTAMGRIDLGQGQMAAALEHLTSTEELLSSAIDDPVRLARVFGIRARIHGYSGQADQAWFYIREALTLATSNPSDASDASDASDLVPHLHIDLARVQALRHDFTGALKSLTRAEREFVKLGSNTGRLRARLYRGHVLATLGSREQAHRWLVAARTRAHELSNRRIEAKAELFLGEQALWHGDRAVAGQHLKAAVRLAGDDTSTRLAASIYLAADSREFPDLSARVERLAMVDLQVAWLLVAADRSDEHGDKHDSAQTLLDRAVKLAHDTTLPLHRQRELLDRTGRSTSARRLEQQIASQLPRGTLRRRFLRFVGPPHLNR